MFIRNSHDHGRFLCRSLIAFLLASVASTALAQGPGRPKSQGRPPQSPNGSPKPDQQPAYPLLPNDQRLLALHRDFVNRAIGLAAEYERARQHEKAAAVYGEILKLVPAHAKAREMLDKIREHDAGANRTVFTVHANRDWQDTGIRVEAGKPFRLAATGKWTFNMKHELGPEGMDIPEVLRDFKLGSLIGVIGGGDPKKIKPFYIGAGTEMVAGESGPLLVRMHDSDTSDNLGRITLEMSGQLERK